jgi:periplasmic protein TonB
LTHEAWVVQRALLGSLVLHALLLTLFFTLPGGGSAEPVQIYTVRIMEAPARPQARALELSTQAISALKLESPSLSPDAPPLPEPEQADVPAVERLPQVQVGPKAGLPPSLAPPAQPSAPAAPELAPPAGGPASALPRLPGLPAEAPRAPAPKAASGKASREAQVLAPPPPAVPDVSKPTAMEQLGRKVQSLELKVESAPPATARPLATPGAERNVLYVTRIYLNRVREAVKQQFTFPGNFDPSLRTQVRVVVNPDGTVQSAEMLKSSGNEQYDRACLTAIRSAKYPSVPRDAQKNADGTFTINMTFAP